jgi:adenylylsulfate kinase
MSKKILIMGLPGSGKTTLAHALAKELVDLNYVVDWFNADDVRKKFEDWDFSHEGRIRQAQRMLELATNSDADFVICDFVAPLPEMRDIFGADVTVWVNTINQGRFEDTNSIFINPIAADIEVNTQDAGYWASIIAAYLNR